MTVAVATLPVGYRAKREASLLRDSERAFARHEIRSAGDRRWMLQRRADDGWTSIFAAEIVVLWGGSILVHGDIEHVIFSHYGDSTEPRAVLNWMGLHDGVDGYVLQKARIGTGDALIETYEPDALEEDLRGMIADVSAEIHEAAKDGDDTDSMHTELDAITDALDLYRDEDRGAVVQALYNAGIDGERLHRIGIVTHPRVYFAHAALRRLCALLAASGP